MKIELTNELKTICNKIVETKLTELEWADHESDDWYQSSTYAGGYDADEKAFCFSYYKKDGTEYWFQFTLAEAHDIANDQMVHLFSRSAES
jgi:hypothetical protein